MSDLQIAYDPEVWVDLRDAGSTPATEAADVVARLGPDSGGSGDTARFLLLAEPAEPPIVVELSVPTGFSGTARQAAAAVFPDAGPEQLEDVRLDSGAVVCRYVRFPQVAEFLPGEPGEEVFVAELHYVRAIPEADPGYALVATLFTPRINELPGIAEQVEKLVELATIA